MKYETLTRARERNGIIILRDSDTFADTLGYVEREREVVGGRTRESLL